MKLIQSMLAGAALLATGLAWAGPVNVNTADAGMLAKELNGVGPVTAAAIVSERGNGNFKDSSDLQKRVKGIGSKTVAKNKENLQF